MSDLRELYQEVILDHSRQPRNFRKLPAATCEAKGDNPLCGDRVTVYLKVKDGIVEDVTFEGRGCAISMASASMMTEVLKGKTEAEVRQLFDRFHDSMTGKSACHGADAVAKVEGLNDIDVDLVWDPPWDKSRMSEAAQLELGMF